MHRFHLPPAACAGSSLRLGKADSHHAVKVLRLREGDRVTVLDGAGQELSCEITAAKPAEVSLVVLGRRAHPAPGFQLTLVQGVTKARSMDWIVQKATELGAHRLVPLLTEHGAVRLDDAEGESKAEKWRAIAIEAMKQCGTPWLPRIDPPRTPSAWLRCGEPFDLSLLATFEADARHPREWVREFEERQGRPPRTLCWWIGPEGDFSAAEIASARAAGVRPATLGPRVLRSETAALAALAALAYELSAPRGALQ
jgi:16S rRNA (uracil1498-N3)-methyltransferase